MEPLLHLFRETYLNRAPGWNQCDGDDDDGQIIKHQIYWLVVWNMTVFFLHILGIIIPTDVHILQRSSNHQPVYITVFQQMNSGTGPVDFG
jgi:hypothetical protein